MKIKADSMKNLEKFGFKRMDNKVFFSDEFHGWQYISETKTSSGMVLHREIIAVHDKKSVNKYREICFCGQVMHPMKDMAICPFSNIPKILLAMYKADMIEE